MACSLSLTPSISSTARSSCVFSPQTMPACPSVDFARNVLSPLQGSVSEVQLKQPLLQEALPALCLFPVASGLFPSWYSVFFSPHIIRWLRPVISLRVEIVSHSLFLSLRSQSTSQPARSRHGYELEYMNVHLSVKTSVVTCHGIIWS